MLKQQKKSDKFNNMPLSKFCTKHIKWLNRTSETLLSRHDALSDGVEKTALNELFVATKNLKALFEVTQKDAAAREQLAQDVK
jgi:hypothetical protein